MVVYFTCDLPGARTSITVRSENAIQGASVTSAAYSTQISTQHPREASCAKMSMRPSRRTATRQHKPMAPARATAPSRAARTSN